MEDRKGEFERSGRFISSVVPCASRTLSLRYSTVSERRRTHRASGEHRDDEVAHLPPSGGSPVGCRRGKRGGPGIGDTHLARHHPRHRDRPRRGRRAAEHDGGDLRRHDPQGHPGRWIQCCAWRKRRRTSSPWRDRGVEHRQKRGGVNGQASLIAELLFSAVGVSYFIYGKKQRAPVPLVCGLVLMVFPYFVSSTGLLMIIGVVLLAMPYFIRL